MAFLSFEELNSIGFKYLGSNVLVSDKVAIYNADKISIGENSRIDDFCVISGKVTIGRNVHVAVFCNIAGGSEGVTLEDFSGLAYGCQVFSQSDDYSGKTLTNPTVPAIFKGETKKAVRIGRHCIVGTNSLIFPGVTLGEGCSVGAVSMVSNDTEEWSIYSGVPAKKLKNRKRDLLELEKDYLMSYSK
jgi:acetyltransferase-like isoleucine patch superfamily enzyme